MRPLLVPAVLVVLVALGGCSGEPTPGPAGPATALTLPPSTSAAPSPGAAPEPGAGDVADCYDGDCEITVTEDTEIPLDPDLDARRITISDITADQARVVIEGRDGSVSSSTGSGSTIVRNDLRMFVEVSGGVVSLELANS